ncbi:MAG: cytochrome C [Thermomicrobiales bacterium]|nr:cytochrome C [Thermomicrobiales bacterium]
MSHAISPDAAAEATQTRSRSFSLSMVQMLILLGTVLFAISHFFVWWELRLNAPQFPTGLFIEATSFEIRDSDKTRFNDIREVDGLNHYIGMMSLGDAAKFEMSVAIPAIVLFVAMGIVAAFWRRRWSSLLVLPIVLFPWVYLADLFYWLWYAGHNLDPMAAITLESFTPRVLGHGKIAQFSTDAEFRIGWYIALAACVVCLVAILVDMRRKRSHA